MHFTMHSYLETDGSIISIEIISFCNCQSGKCLSAKRLVGEMSGLPARCLSAKCLLAIYPSAEIPVGEKSVGDMSVAEMSLYQLGAAWSHLSDIDSKQGNF